MDLRPTTSTTPSTSSAPVEHDGSASAIPPVQQHTSESRRAHDSGSLTGLDGTNGAGGADGAHGARGVAEAVELDGMALLDENALRRLLATQPVIEQAKGLLMGCYRLDPDQAFALLRRWSSHGHVKVRDLAARLVETAAEPSPYPFRPADAHLDI